MATDINRVTLTGNLTRDSELKQTASGASVLTFGLAVNERRKNQQTGEWEDKPNYVDCTMFGDRCVKLQQYLVKGTGVAIDGRLNYRSWTAEDGSKRSRLTVTVEDFRFMSRANGGDGNRQQVAQPKPRPTQEQVASGEYYDEEIPF